MEILAAGRLTTHPAAIKLQLSQRNDAHHVA
jgi:hypothetical protein